MHTVEGGAVPVEVARLERVWEPLTIGSVTVPNRLMMTPHGIHYGVDGLPTERLFAYFEERARGGAGLLGCNGTAGHRFALGGGTRTGLNAYDPRGIPAFGELASRVHAHGTKLFVELAASGVNDTARTFHDEWHPVWGLSRVPSSLSREQPAVMNEAYIGTLISDFAQSARNMQEAGVDGVELHGANGYLFMQALSPIFNTRSDAYGGNARKRCRLLIETAAAIRERVGDGFPIGLRYAITEFLDGFGITSELAEEHLSILCDAGVFDYFSITAGGEYALHRSVVPMGGDPEGYLVPYADRARAIVAGRAKVFVVGRIRSVSHAEEILRSGAADMVALTRAQIADPHLVRKAKEGRARTTVRCIGANECITSANQPVHCAVNPVVGREWKWSTIGTTARPQRIQVVGAGPAGLRFAATAAARGHDLTVRDRCAHPGGHLHVLRQMPLLADWGAMVDDLVRLATDEGVRIELEHDVTVDDLEQLDGDALVVATGSRWDSDGYSSARPHLARLPGSDEEHVLDLGSACERAIEDPRSLGGRVLVLDETGRHLPLGLSLMLASAGVDVLIATRQAMVGQVLTENFQAGVVFPALVERGVKFRPQVEAESVTGKHAVLRSIWDREISELDVDTVVISMLRSSVDELSAPGRQRFETVHLLGDALAPRMASEVVFEAERLAREV